MALTRIELDRYREQGLVVPDFRLPQSTLERIDAAWERLLAANAGDPGFTPDFVLGPHLANDSGYGVRGDPEWLQFAGDPALLDIVEQLIGPDLILWGMTIFGKPANRGKETPWHQDGDYYPIEPLETRSVWISLDGSNADNGCMRFIPGSHRDRIVYRHRFEQRDDRTLAQVLDDERVDLSAARDVVLERGQISLHDVFLVHGSNANRSAHRRVGLVLRFMPGSSFYDHARGAATEAAGSAHGYSRRPLYLMRGRDRSGRNDFRIGH